jgi:phosphate/sulfate permease
MTVDERLRFITNKTSRSLDSGYLPAWSFESIQKREEHSNWTWLHGKKNAAIDAATRLLVALVAVLTFIALIAVFGVWTSARRIIAAVGRKSRTVKEPSDWFVISRG